VTRPTSPFAAPPPRKVKPAKRDTAAEAAEKAWVRQRDLACVARWIAVAPRTQFTRIADTSPCNGPLEVDHVRASGGLGIKSPTHRSNMVLLCHWHHRLKTEYGKVWRPLLLAYLERVEPAA
jgi:hypothetical protein